MKYFFILILLTNILSCSTSNNLGRSPSSISTNKSSCNHLATAILNNSGEALFPIDPIFVGEEHGKALVWQIYSSDYRVKYLTDKNRGSYKITAKNGQLFKGSKKYDCPNSSCRQIFVLAPNHEIYVGQDKNMSFHHSSFLGGKPVLAAGTFTITDNKISAIDNISGHYSPSFMSNFRIIKELSKQKIPLDEDLEINFYQIRKNGNLTNVLSIDWFHFKKMPDIYYHQYPEFKMLLEELYQFTR